MPPARGDSASTKRRPQIASLTKYLPFPGIPHAGGQYLLQHYRALGEHCDIDAYAPSTAVNREAVHAEVDGLRSAAVLRGRGLFAEGRLPLLADLDAAARGSTVTHNVTLQLRRDPELHRRLAAADLVEFQWSETASLAHLVRRGLPDAKLVFVAHDLITQRWRRRAQELSNPLAKAAYAAAAARSAGVERRALETVDRVVLFSEKDAALAAELAPSASVSVVHPGLDAPPADAERPSGDAGSPVVLFTGAMNRPDNHEGVAWFLARVWPEVVRRMPEARFVVAGANPPQRLVEQAAQLPSVELTGYVDSLEPFYAAARVFVAPLFTGAGVKFKTIDAMLRRVPIVSTEVGAEGLGGPELYGAVTADPAAFAEAVVAELRSPDAARTERARAWAAERFGFAGFAARLNDVYREVLDA